MEKVQVAAGKLRHRVQLCQPQPKTNTFNEAVVERGVVGAGGFVKQTTRWASIEPLTGRELFVARQVQADVTHKVTIRYYQPVDPTWVVIYQGRTLAVRYVLNIEERNRAMELLCVEQK